MNWTDASIYSRNEKRIPFCWQVKVGVFRLRVHRHFDYEPDQWLASCVLFEHRVLDSTEIDEAKREAVAYLRSLLEAAIREIGETSA